MKRVVILTLALATMFSCAKQEPPQQEEKATEEVVSINQLTHYDKSEIQDILNDLDNEGMGPLGWLVDRIVDFIQAHTGRPNLEFEIGCDGGGDCGSCPALCLNGSSGPIGGIINPSGELTVEDYELGYRMYSLSLLTNVSDGSHALYFEFENDKEDFIDNDNFYINYAAVLSSEISGALGMERITLSPGVYPVIYTEGIARTVVYANFE